jgi:hypothetical protein
MGFVYVTGDLLKLLRWLLVNASYTEETRPKHKCHTREFSGPDIEASNSPSQSEPSPVISEKSLLRWTAYTLTFSPSSSIPRSSYPDLSDQPHLRVWARRMDAVMLLFYIASIVTGCWGNSYFGQQKTIKVTELNQRLRYVFNLYDLRRPLMERSVDILAVQSACFSFSTQF